MTDGEVRDFQSMVLPEGLASQRVLRGAIDLHVHGYPDVAEAYRSRGDDLANIRLAMSYGIDGWVLKSHLWPTMDRVRLLREHLRDTTFTLVSSVVLNRLTGGIDPAVVEAAHAHGAGVIFFPTWSAHADAGRGGFIMSIMRGEMPRMPDYAQSGLLAATDPNGKLTAAAKEVVETCAALGLTLCTGHVSIAESRAIVEHAASIDYRRVVVTHPVHYVETVDELVYLAELGAFIEFPNGSLFHPTLGRSFGSTYEAVAALGPSQVVLTTDVFAAWVPPEAECFRIFIEQMLHMGVSEGDLTQMVVANPRRVLGLPAVAN